MPNQNPENTYPGNLQYVGGPGVVIRNYHVEQTPKGTTTHFDVECPIIETLIALYNEYILYGATVDFVGIDGGAERSLQVSFPGLIGNAGEFLEEVYFDSWEMLTNEETDSIFNDPYLINAYGGDINYNAFVVLSRLLTDGGTVSQAVTNCNADVTAGTLTAPTTEDGGTSGGMFQAPNASDSPVVSQLALEIQKGQTDFDNPTYALRHTSYCSPGVTYNSAVENVMEIYTVAQLLSEVGNGWTYNCPPRLLQKISSATSALAALPPQPQEEPFYVLGWLKKISRETTLPNFMIEVSTEYALAYWSNLRYKPL